MSILLTHCPGLGAATGLPRENFPLLQGPTGTHWGWEQAASGVFGVWARENARESLWDAMYRREAFATTGPGVTVRFFGGFGFTPADLNGDHVRAGCEKGVPMGRSFGRTRTCCGRIHRVRDEGS